jgi:hypothetical protein
MAKQLRSGLLAACEDPRLFGFHLWPRQRELLEVVECGPRIHAWALGRRSGKTTLAAIACLHTCLRRPELDELVGRARPATAWPSPPTWPRPACSSPRPRSVVEPSPRDPGRSDRSEQLYYPHEARLTRGPAGPFRSPGLRASTRLGEAAELPATHGERAAHSLSDLALAGVVDSDGERPAPERADPTGITLVRREQAAAHAVTPGIAVLREAPNLVAAESPGAGAADDQVRVVLQGATANRWRTPRASRQARPSAPRRRDRPPRRRRRASARRPPASRPGEASATEVTDGAARSGARAVAASAWCAPLGATP